MRRRTLKLVAHLSGFPMALGEVTVEKFAKLQEAETILTCPNDGEVPTWKGEYTCEKCGTKYNHWSRLQRLVKATRQIIEKPKLSQEHAPAEVYVMKAEDYANKYADATLDEHGIVAKDPQTAMNVKKLLVAVERLGLVVIVRFADTYEERICLLAVTMSGRVVLREIIPVNLALIGETLRINMADITEADVIEAQQLVKILKNADENTFKVSDYRTIGIAERPVESPKVQSFQEILAKVGQ